MPIPYPNVLHREENSPGFSTCNSMLTTVIKKRNKYALAIFEDDIAPVPNGVSYTDRQAAHMKFRGRPLICRHRVVENFSDFYICLCLIGPALARFLYLPFDLLPRNSA